MRTLKQVPARRLPLLLLVVACTQRTSKTGVPGDTSRGSGNAPTELLHEVPQAEHRLGRYLAAALDTKDNGDPSAYMSCVPMGQTDRYLTLARYRVLNSVLRGDTADVSAQVVTVAEERWAPHAASNYVTTVRIRTDTLHWAMTTDSSTKQWGVCGYPNEGVGFGHYGDDQQTVWTPPGMTWSRVRQMVDSISRSGTP